MNATSLRRSKKANLIEAILRNGVYMPDSGLVNNLRAALGKLSMADVHALDLIVSIKAKDPHVATISEGEPKPCCLRPEALQHLIDTEKNSGLQATVEVHPDGSVTVTYRDGSINQVVPSAYQPFWNYARSASRYAAGYAYACGCHD